MSVVVNPKGSFRLSLNMLLTGLSVATANTITALDTVLTALGKLQAQITANKVLLTPITRKIGPTWYVSGRYFDSTYPYGLAAASANYPAGTLMYFPFLALEDVTFDQFAINCTSAVASSTVTLAVFDSDANNLPLNRLVQTAPLDTATTGVKTATISQAMTAGSVYWIAFLVLGGNPTFSAASSAYFQSFIGNAASATNTPCCYQLTAQSAIPAVASVNNSLATAVSLPLARLRAA